MRRTSATDLLETVRQYALERLAESGDEADTRDRHLGFYVELAERARPELNGPKQAAWAARLDAERENILLAFAHARSAPGGAPAALAMAHGLFMWLAWKDFELWRRVLLEALAHPDAQQEEAGRSRALYVASYIVYVTGRYEESFSLAQSSVELSRKCGDVPALAEGLYSLGIAAIAVGRQADAREHFTEGLALARAAGARRSIATLSCGLGELYSQQGQFELAESAYLEALATSPDDPTVRVIGLHNLARNAIALRDAGKAVRFLREALVGEKPQISMAILQFLMNCAGIASLREEWTLALRLGGAAYACQERDHLWGDFVDAPFLARHVSEARAALGTEAADAALAAGRAMDVATALREAEAWLASLPVDGRTP